VASSSNSFFNSQLEISLERVTFLILRPTDKQLLASLGPWKYVFLHRSHVNSFDLHRMCSWYFTRLVFNYCSIVRALIGCSINICTCPSIALVTFASSSAHNKSFLVCDSTMSHKSTKLSGFRTRGVDILHLVNFRIQFLSDSSVKLQSQFCSIVGGSFSYNQN
jgi:hypothetical protein